MNNEDLSNSEKITINIHAFIHVCTEICMNAMYFTLNLSYCRFTVYRLFPKGIVKL